MKNIVIIVMAIALVAGVPLAIISHSTSPYKIIEKDLVRLDYNTNYRYIAHVNKSIIYYNRDTVDMNEPLYIPLTKSLDFNMTFTISNLSDEIVENKGLIGLRVRLVEPEGWSILLNNLTYIMNSTNTTINFDINVSKLKEIIESIRKEIGLSSLEYNIEVDPIIKTTTKLKDTIIDKIVEPKLILSLDFQRNKIVHDKLNFTDTYKKTNRQITPATLSILGFTFTVQNLRYVSYALILAGVFSALFVMITREKMLASVIDTFLRKYDNIIVKATTITSSSRKVLVKDFRELLRISRLLGKPIVYYKEGDLHVFTVIDAETLYVLSLSDEGRPIVN